MAEMSLRWRLSPSVWIQSKPGAINTSNSPQMRYIALANPWYENINTQPNSDIASNLPQVEKPMLTYPTWHRQSCLDLVSIITVVCHHTSRLIYYWLCKTLGATHPTSFVLYRLCRHRLDWVGVNLNSWTRRAQFLKFGHCDFVTRFCDSSIS